MSNYTDSLTAIWSAFFECLILGIYTPNINKYWLIDSLFWIHTRKMCGFTRPDFLFRFCRNSENRGSTIPISRNRDYHTLLIYEALILGIILPFSRTCYLSNIPWQPSDTSELVRKRPTIFMNQPPLRNKRTAISRLRTTSKRKSFL